MKLKNWFMYLFFAVPSIAIGAIIMYLNEVPTVIWLQNVIAFVVFSLISRIVVTKHLESKKSKDIVAIVIIVLLLGMTFLNDGMEGVHRWIKVKGMWINVAMILMPALLILMGNLLEKEDYIEEEKKLTKSCLLFAILISGVVLVMLMLQPDASQLTGFAIPAAILICRKNKNLWFRSFFVCIVVGLVAISWIHLDHLPAVEYVENIVQLTAKSGTLWLIAGIIALILQPIPFFLLRNKQIKSIARCVGLSIILINIATLFGNFPVPLMGYGISPIAGYVIALTMLYRQNQ